MAIKEILLLGNPLLNQKSEFVTKNDTPFLKEIFSDLHDTMMDFRSRYNAGRAIAAPQIGVLKRIIYMNIDKPVEIINPELTDFSKEMITLWDDCMSFPELLVKVKRHKRCKIKYYDLEWNFHEMNLAGDLSELIQHEVDHLNGILATERALDKNSFAMRSQKKLLTI
jgi:peptide deformylase